MTNLNEQSTHLGNNLAARPDYRQLDHRWEGFHLFYQFHVDTGDYAPYLPVERWLIAKHRYPTERQFALAFFTGCIGNVPSTPLMAQEFPEITPKTLRHMALFFGDNKPRLMFAPDNKYRKIVFERFLASVAGSLRHYGNLSDYIASAWDGTNQERNFRNLQAMCFRDWFHWGHYGHWCFTEALYDLMAAPIRPPMVEFALNASVRMGWALAMGHDNLAGIGIHPRDTATMEKEAAAYIESLGKTKASYFSLETACCNYKRQHKASHYGGCYIDEQYDEIQEMQHKWPERQGLWNELWAARKAMLPASLLYENYHRSGKAYQTVMHRTFIDTGRIPRVEAWLDKTPQVWPSAPNGEMVISNSI